MEQKTTWMRYLTLGLIISLISVFYSCKEDFFTIIGEYHFVNETNHIITFPVGYEKFNVAAQSKVVINERGKGAGKENIRESDFSSPFYSLPVTNLLTIKFDQTKCLVNLKVDDEHSIRDIKNFIAEKLGENHYKFTYTFTEADYNRAVACP